jgi:hypothetical protein
VLAIKEINRGLDFQAGFANKFGGCVSRLSGGAWEVEESAVPRILVFSHSYKIPAQIPTPSKESYHRRH